MQDARLHVFEAVRNFRDFGGYASRFGGHVVQRALFRSGHYGEASAADIARLSDMRIHLQADLRRPDERERQPGKWSAPVTLTHDGGREHEAPHIRFLSEVEVSPDQAESWMIDYYHKAPFKAHHQALFRDWFAGLAALPQGHGALVNCAAGKDRTGILCALTHHLLGVSEDDIRADYDLTNRAADVDARLPEAAAWFNKSIGRNYPAEVYRPFMGVRLTYLDTALARIVAETGSLDTYLTDVLGVDAAKTGAIRARFIAPAA
jgi:protein-tyrosine phosphatase